MGLNSIHMNEIIFGSTEHRAISKLNIIKDEIINNGDEVIEKETRNDIMTNKRRIKAVKFSNNSRGYRCSEVYVDYDLKIGDVYGVILPIINNGYYGKENKSWTERIHIFN
jgi:hypothetical protein